MKYTINRQKLCWEDFEWGFGTVQQMRGNVLVELTQLNAGLFPFNDTLSLEEVVTQVENDRIAAGVSEGNALASEQAALASEQAASASEVNALASEQAALASEQAAAAIFDAFDDRYLGSKASAPLVDNDGNPLLDGALYYDTTVNYLHVYDLGTTTWLSLPVTILAALTDVNLVSLSEGEMLSWDSGTSKWINIDISSAVQTLTNKTLDSITNFIGANHIHCPIRNESGVEIPKGTVITASSTQSGTDYIEVVPVTDPLTQVALGITHTALADNATGLAINTGVCIDMVNTSTWAEGTILYPNNSGGLTEVKPTSGRYQACAVVTRSHATQGTLLVEFSEPKYIASTTQSGYVQLVNDLITDDSTKALTAAQGKILRDILYTKTELDGGQLDNRYYTETELDVLLALKASLTGATFTGQVKGIAPLAAEDLTRKDYVDTALALKADQVTTYTSTEVDTQISNRMVGFKNLLHNPNKTIRQRGTTGGRRQVIDALNVELSGSYVISFTGTATVRIYEATTLGTSDATTTWTELTAGASASGTVVTVTAGKYVKVEFSTTDFSFAQFEKGTIPTSFEQRAQLEPYLCLPYYEEYSEVVSVYSLTKATQLETSAQCEGSFQYIPKRVTPSVSISGISGFTTSAITSSIAGFRVTGSYTVTNVIARFTGFIANAEHFTDTYYEDRWF